MWKRVNIRLLSTAGVITTLIAVLEAGRKWH